MGRKERRYQVKTAKEASTRKTVKADHRVLTGLGIAFIIIVVVTYLVRYSGAS